MDTKTRDIETLFLLFVDESKSAEATEFLIDILRKHGSAYANDVASKAHNLATDYFTR